MRTVILSGGIETSHSISFVSEEKQNNLWRIMCFSTPFFIVLDGGTYVGKPGDCIFEYGNFHRHGSPFGQSFGFVNSWCHIMSDSFGNMLECYGIPIDTIFNIGRCESLFSRFSDLLKESESGLPFSEVRCELLSELLVSEIARAYIQKEKAVSISDSSAAQVSRIREKMLESCHEDWTVPVLAAEAGLCESRFSVIYKSLYGISPINELINKRISTAEFLLITTDKSIKKIAAECGYRDANYFTRSFCASVGISPQKFRASGMGCKQL